MSIKRAERVDAPDMLERLLAITYDILQADGLEPAAQSIAAGFGEVFGWRYVTIVAASEPGGELRRRAMWGYPPAFVVERLNEAIPYPEVAAELQPEYEVFPNCYHVGAESGRDTEHNLYTGDLPRDAPRASETAWHERDLLVLVLVDGNQKMLGYLSPDHPVDGQIPDFGTLRKMQIFVNLLGLALSNAVKYSPEGSPVLVELRERLHDVYLAVSNEGQGIRTEDRSKLFTRFGRLSHGSQSTGLGLYICKQLVTMMHGSIDVELEPGRRTTFWCAIPKANADD